VHPQWRVIHAHLAAANAALTFLLPRPSTPRAIGRLGPYTTSHRRSAASLLRGTISVSRLYWPLQDEEIHKIMASERSLIAHQANHPMQTPSAPRGASPIFDLGTESCWSAFVFGGCIDNGRADAQRR
jgi:hypothetical protein